MNNFALLKPECGFHDLFPNGLCPIVNILVPSQCHLLGSEETACFMVDLHKVGVCCLWEIAKRLAAPSGADPADVVEELLTHGLPLRVSQTNGCSTDAPGLPLTASLHHSMSSSSFPARLVGGPLAGTRLRLPLPEESLRVTVAGRTHPYWLARLGCRVRGGRTLFPMVFVHGSLVPARGFAVDRHGLNSRQQIADFIGALPEYFAVCEGCGLLVQPRRYANCPHCAGYRIEATPDAVRAAARLLREARPLWAQ